MMVILAFFAGFGSGLLTFLFFTWVASKSAQKMLVQELKKRGLEEEAKTEEEKEL